MKRILLWSLPLILIDQTTKFFLVKTINYGAAFGLFQGKRWLLIFISFFVLGIFFSYYKKVNKYGVYGMILLFSGIIGNLIDRLFFGYVRDFIDLGFWPVFNLADTYTSIGTIILIISFVKDEISSS